MQTYEGKAKIVTPQGANEVSIFFKNDATAFNGVKKASFEEKGHLNAEITTRLFRKLEASGIKTHFISRTDERTLRCRAVTIVPLEVVVRFKVAGSLKKRTGLADGAAVTPPIVELYFKNDALGDPLFNDEHVQFLKLATPAEVATLKAMALKTALALRDLLAKARIDLVDLKFEYGRTSDGEILLADEISPDTCRLRDLDTGASLDKDNFREDKGDLLTAYREVLKRLDVAGIQ